jgi:hypothetical protein
MKRTLITCLLAATTALAQAPAESSKQQQQPSGSATQSQPAGPPSLLKRDEKPAEVAPNQAVLTIRGICPAPTGVANKPTVPSTSECVTTLTKEQFDNMVNSLNSNHQVVTPDARRKLADNYVELLVFSEAGKAADIENSPAYAEVMRILRMRTLASLYESNLEEQLKNQSRQEVEAYYQQNLSKYEGAKISRIFIPKNLPDPKTTEEQKQAFQKKAAQVADDIQARAAKGEDTDKLQKEAFTSLDLNTPPPSTKMNTVRHGMFPAKLEQEVFSHKAGEVFRTDETSGYMIYRVENRDPLPLDSVRDQILNQIVRTKVEEKNKELMSPVHAELNDQYFGPATPVAPRPAAPPTLNPPK